MIPTKEQCEAYRDNLLLSGKKSGYVLQIVKAIRHYGNYLNRDLKIKYPKKDKQQLPNFLTELELKQLLYSTKGIKERLILMLMSVCGLRINEVAKLKVEDIKFDEGWQIRLYFCHQP
jgi:integrase